jgi:hypothetical protein
MTRPTQFGTPYPQGVEDLGGDPTLPEGQPEVDCCDDAAEMPDRALDTPVEIGVHGGDGALIQSKAGSTNGGAFSLTYDTDPIAGNLLVATQTDRGGTTPASLTGWTEIAQGGAVAAQEGYMWWRLAPGGSVTVNPSGQTNERRLVIMEFDGTATLEDFSNLVTQTTGTNYDLPDVTVSGTSVLVGFVVTRTTIFPLTYTDDADYTLVDTGFASATGSLQPQEITSYRQVSAGTYDYNPTGSATAQWGGVLGAFDLPDDGWIGAGSEITDGDDATYQENSGPNVVRVWLGDAFAIGRIRLVIGTETAGARTYTLKGANISDYSDAVTVATLNFTATGSFTADTVTESWVPADSYEFWELTGNDETRYVYSFELYEQAALTPADIAGLAEDVATLQTDVDALEATVSGLGAGRTVIVPGFDGVDADPWPIMGGGTSGTSSSSLTVQEVDGSPSGTVTTIVVPDNSLTINGSTATLRDVPSAFIGVWAVGTSTALSNAAYTSLAFASADTFDTDGFHDPSSNNTRLTVPAGLGGKYLFVGRSHWPNGSSSTDRRLSYRINGGSDAQPQYRETYASTVGVATYAEMVTVLDLAAGDYVELRQYVNIGSQTAADYWAQLVKLDSGKVGGGIGCSVIGNSQALTNSAFTSLAFNATDVFDTDGFHDPSSNNTRITIPAGLGGKYLLSGYVTFPNSTTASSEKRIGYRLDGGTDVILHRQTVATDTAGSTGYMGIPPTVLDLVPGQYVEVRAWSTNANAQTTTLYTAQLMRLDSGSSAYTGAVWGSGTAFPAGPSTNQRFTRTDLGMDFYYDGTRWLSTQLFTLEGIPGSTGTSGEMAAGGVDLAATTTSGAGVIPVPSLQGGSDIYLVNYVATFFVNGGTALSASHKWAIGIQGINSAGGSSGIEGTLTIDSGSSSVYRTQSLTLGAVKSATVIYWRLDATKTGTPGNFRCASVLTYRLVAT